MTALHPSPGTTGGPSADRLGDLLVAEGLINQAQLRAALADQKTSHQRLGYILVKQGAVAELELTKVLARQYRMPAVDLSRFEVDLKLLPLVPADLAAKRMVLPLRREGRTLTVAVADPADQGLVEDLKFITRFDLFPMLAGEATLRALIERHYETGDEQLQTILKEMEGVGDDVEIVEDEDDEVTNAAALQAAVDDAPVVKLINGILTDAVKRGASDIHVEPFEHELRIRYRIDGSLVEVMKPPLKMKAALTSRIKILASLNIAERRVPLWPHTGGRFFPPAVFQWRESNGPRQTARTPLSREIRAA
jgi:type IV pilus assembly protein PilB